MEQAQGASSGTNTAELFALTCYGTRDMPGMAPGRRVGQNCTTSGIFCSRMVLENCIVGSVLLDREWNRAECWAKSLISPGGGADAALLLREEQCQRWSQLALAVAGWATHGLCSFSCFFGACRTLPTLPPGQDGAVFLPCSSMLKCCNCSSVCRPYSVIFSSLSFHSQEALLVARLCCQCLISMSKLLCFPKQGKIFKV